MSEHAENGVVGAHDAAQKKAAAQKAYNEIVEKADLEDIRLIDLKFSVKPAYYEAFANEMKGQGKVVRAFQFSLADVSYDPAESTLGGQIEWMIEATSKKKKLLSIVAKFFVVYDGVPNVDEEHKRAFLVKVGKFATYPYFRNLVAQMSWEAKADLPVMPVLK